MEELAGKSAYMRQIESDRQKMKPMITDLTEQINAFKPVDMLQLEVFVAEVLLLPMMMAVCVCVYVCVCVCLFVCVCVNVCCCR